MSIVNVVRGEFVKALTLPGVWAGLGVGVLASVALTLLNASTVRSAIRSGDLSRVADTSTFETVFAIMPLGTVGAVIIAVMVMVVAVMVVMTVIMIVGMSAQQTNSLLNGFARRRRVGGQGKRT